MAHQPKASQADLIRRINLTLEGPVAEIMAQLVPELKKLPRRGVLECVLDDPDLLDRCFKAFRANTDRFASLLVDQHNVPVDQADAVLACGRSLEDVVAMVVRTHAKRHFRKRLDGESRSLHASGKSAAKPAKSDGMVNRLVSLFVASQPATPLKGRGEVLYEAFQDNLRHDWQVPLVPEYSTLSPQLVRRLGVRILDYKVPEDIRRLRDSPRELPVPSTLPEAIPSFLLSAKAQAAAAKPVGKPIGLTPTGAAPSGESRMAAAPETAKPAAVQGDRRARLAEVLTPDGKRLRAAAFTMVLLDPKVRDALPNPEQTVRITGVLAEMGGLSAKMLVNDLGLRTDQLAVTCISLYEMLGEDMFRRSFGVPGNLDYVSKFVDRAKAAGINQDTELVSVSAFVVKMFAAMKKTPAASR